MINDMKPGEVRTLVDGTPINLLPFQILVASIIHAMAVHSSTNLVQIDASCWEHVTG